nr:sulfotransferase [Salinibacter ruber]
MWNKKKSDREHIFVMGPPRSGTTLVKRVLETHSGICGLEGETWFFLRNNYADFRHQSIPDEVMEKLVEESRSIAGLFDRVAESVREKGCERVLEKTARHALRMRFIADRFPRSTLIFVVRDPRDCVRSAREHPIIWTNYPDDDRLGGYMEVWRKSVQEYLQCCKRQSVILVQYEDFCRNPGERLRVVMDRIDVKFEKQQLKPARYRDTSSADVRPHKRLREPISPKSVGRWREKLAKDTVARIETTLTKEMERMGYSTTLV